MLILTRQEVERLLDLDKLVDALAAAMADLSAGHVSMPARNVCQVREHGGLLAAMPVYLSSLRVLSTKLVTLYPGNAAGPLPTHQAAIVVFDASTGAPRALMDGTFITAARTAAGSALATRLLARPDADVLTIIGTGVQARAHARAIPRVRRVKEIRVAGRSRDKAQALAAEISKELGVPAAACAPGRVAFQGAGIICATTCASTPVVRGEWLEPGTHVNSVGMGPGACEVDPEAVRRARVVVESRAAALAPEPSGANDLTWAIRDGVVPAGHVRAEIGEVVAGRMPGRTSREEITLYKSVGVAVQDAAAAQLVLEAAQKQGVGKDFEI
jgi:ornithine cyclodeaminase/alanine dehydrogenase-like protein (mu-crystallin family)